MLFGIFSNMAVYAQGSPPTINQCKRAWVLTTTQEMNFGGFAAEAGVANITMNSFGGLTTAGLVNLSSSIPAATWVVNVDNTRDAFCASYGFTLDWRRPLRPLRGAGANIPLNNVLISIPAYGLNGVLLPQTIVANPGNTVPFTIMLYGEITVTSPQTAGEYSRRQVFEFTQDTRSRRVRADVFATSLVPLSIAEIIPMDFGALAGGPVAGTVVLDTNGVRLVTGDVRTLGSGTASAASFQIFGEPNQVYSLSFSDGSLVNTIGDLVDITTFTNNSQGTIPGVGNETFEVGATLSIGSNQSSGDYSTSNAGGIPYTITINYN